MKRKVNLYILLIVFSASLMVSFFVAGYSYKILKDQIRSEKRAVADRVSEEYKLFEFYLSLIEKHIHVNNEAGIAVKANALIKLWGNAQDIPVDSLKKMTFELDADALYLIGRNGQVLNSSKGVNTAFDFKYTGDSFVMFLDELFLHKNFDSYSLGVNKETGKLEVCTYYVPFNADYAVAVTVDVQSFLSKEYSYFSDANVFLGLKDRLIFEKDVIADIDLFVRSDNYYMSLLSANKDLPLVKGDIERLNINGVLETSNMQSHYYYKVLDLKTRTFGFPSNPILFVKFDFHHLYDDYKRLLFLDVIFTLIVMLVVSIVSPIFVDKLLLKRIDTVKHNLNAIRYAQYDNLQQVHGRDEIAEIAENIAVLRDSVVTREVQLQVAKKQAVAADKLKSAFLANMSHEIRTPLNAVVGFSQLLRDANPSADDIVRYVDLINSNSAQLLQIICDIIDLSQIESGQMTIVPRLVCLNELTAELYANAKSKLVSSESLNMNKDIDIFIDKGEMPSGECIVSDPYRLKQIFTQLIDNALKFTCKGQIRFGYELIGTKIKFFVKDTGIGISEENIATIFERFVQGEDYLTREYGGTGLGLAICRELVVLMDGEIEVESELGIGSVFSFILPYNVNENK